jgi:hypothetical protein
MQSAWGPRVFWFVVFLLICAGVYALFYEPQPELGKLGSHRTVENVLKLSPNLAGFEMQVGLLDQAPTDWTGRVTLSGGKVVQINPSGRAANWSLEGSQFQLSTRSGDRGIEPVTLYIVAEPAENATVRFTLREESKDVSLAELAPGRTVELFGGKARIKRTAPVQIYGNDTASDDVAPTVTTDAAGNPYLVYLNCTKSKGVDVPGLLGGSFESLERPVVGVTLRLSRFANDNWQYSEPVVAKLDSAFNPVPAIDNTNRMYVAWCQLGNEGTDIYYSHKEFATSGDSSLSWSNPVKLTAKPGAHQHLVAVADAKGKVWLAWQTWHHDHFEIYAAVLNDTKHAWSKPGPVAEHGRDEDGRWNPAITADGHGNVYVAWSVFRGGHFDVALAKLSENSIAGPPTYLAASPRQEQRPSLRCDPDNNVWIAYEESEESAQPPNPGTPHAVASRVHVRVYKPDGRLEDVPLVPRPIRQADASRTEAPACRQPRLILTKSGGIVVCFESQQRLFISRLQNEGWSEPEEFIALRPEVNPAIVYHHDHLCAFFEGSDGSGHARLCLATHPEPSAAAPTTARTTVTPDQLVFKELPDWRKFAENAQHFRKRPEDLVVSRRYLLRGLLLSDKAREQDLEAFTASALEQGIYDWIALPRGTATPPALGWLQAQRAMTMAQSERRILTGYYRPITGQRQGVFVLERKPLDQPLPSLRRLQSILQDVRGEGVFASQANDQKMLNQYLVQTQNVGFLVTEDWRLLASMNKPSAGTAFGESGDNVLIPFWYPVDEPGRPAPLGIRVVAFTYGKSQDDLIDALRERRFYSATDDIHLIARCEKRVPGEIFQTSFKPKISVVVQGTSKLARVEIWQDDKPVQVDSPPGVAAVLEYENTAADNAWHSYSVRVEQADGAIAVTQPMWIRYVP